MIEIRPATADDIPQLVDVGTEFFVESNFFGDLTIDKVQGAGTFGYLIAAEDNHILVAMDEGKLVGFISFDVVRFYTVEPVSHMFLFYVIPEYRKTLLGRELLQKALEVAAAHGSKRFYASSTAGFNDGGKTNKRLLNLYRRFGFEELGCFVMKGINDV
jgi:ribosomal protein S18 acetylase RimI-like enzyme